MLAHCVVDDWAEHPLDLVRVKRAGCSCASDKKQVGISPEVYVTSIEAVEGGDHDHKPLAHAALEEFAPNIVPLVQPVVALPHLLSLSIGVFHRDCPGKLPECFCHAVCKQEYCLRGFPESAEELVN